MMSQDKSIRKKQELHRFNFDGFRFIGIADDGTEFPCIVETQENGWGRVYDETDGSRAWDRLAAWRMHQSQSERPTPDNLPRLGP